LGDNDFSQNLDYDKSFPIFLFKDFEKKNLKIKKIVFGGDWGIGFDIFLTG
jgi:hypothetical protein